VETFDAVFRDLRVRIGQIRAEYLTVTTGIVRKLIQVDGELFIVFPYAYVIRATASCRLDSDLRNRFTISFRGRFNTDCIDFL
jgi:hypothetical protein